MMKYDEDYTPSRTDRWLAVAATILLIGAFVLDYVWGGGQ